VNHSPPPALGPDRHGRPPTTTAFLRSTGVGLWIIFLCVGVGSPRAATGQTVRGTIFISTGENCYAARYLPVVLLHSESGRKTQIYTDSDGSFTFFKVRAGRYDVLVDGRRVDEFRTEGKPSSERRPIVVFRPTWSRDGSTPLRRGPQLTSPPKGAELDNGRRDRRDGILWRFVWRPMAGATNYWIKVEKCGAGHAEVNDSLKANTFAYRSRGGYVSEENRYMWVWRVRAKVAGRWTDWSDGRTFSVEPVDRDPPS